MDNESVRNVFMDLLKKKFVGFHFWNNIEPEIAIMCSGLPEPIDEDKTKELVKKLTAIKGTFEREGVQPDDLKFISDEIGRYEKTKVLSLYEPKDEIIEDHIVNFYAREGRSKGAVISIKDKFNYSQLAKLTNAVYRKTGTVKFYISPERTYYGKIVAEIYDHPQEIPVATIVESVKIDKETGDPMYKGVSLFGQKINKREMNIIEELPLKLYVYRFITEDNNEMILMSLNQHEIGDYVITGVVTKCDDYRMLTDSARLPTKLPFFFAQSLKSRIIKFKSHSEMFERANFLKIDKDKLFDYPFTVKKGTRTWKLLQPKWYKWLIWSWLTHENKGLMNNYPMHLIILGDKHSGKSLLLNGLHARSKETREIFSGSSSTLKSLVPSFKYNPAKLGYLAESNRFSFCDEFLRCLINTRTTKEGSAREEGVAIMNDLLEHQKREAGSGVSKVKVNMTARVIATTNPIRDIKSVGDLVNALDESFLSRWLIYYQTDEHIQMIRRSRDSSLKEFDFKLSTNDWISFLDYLQTFSSKYDMEIVSEIHGSIPKVLSETLNKHYDARHLHHIECLIDGIVKTRCFIQGDESFEANEEDYKILKEVWFNIIGSWLNPQLMKKMDVSERVNYLPENCQYLFYKVVEFKAPVSREKLNEFAMKAMTKREYIESWNILLDLGVLKEKDGIVRPHYMSDSDDDLEQRRL